MPAPTATYRTVVFDLDGTLLDTLEDLMLSTNAALAVNQMPQHSLEDVRRFMGNGIATLIHRAVPAGTPDNAEAGVLADFRRIYGEHCEDHSGPYDGVPEMLASLRQAGLALAVVSNKADFAVQELVERWFPGTFDAVLGENEAAGISRKPSSAMVEAALARMGRDHEGLVYVGDSEVDILTAENSGCPCVSVTWGFRTRDELLRSGATVLVDAPAELADVLLARG